MVIGKRIYLLVKIKDVVDTLGGVTFTFNKYLLPQYLRPNA